MDDYTLLVDLHKQGHRQGPGGDAETEKALNIAIVDRTVSLKIADIGCGTGASTLVLANLLNAQKARLFAHRIFRVAGTLLAGPVLPTHAGRFR